MRQAIMPAMAYIENFEYINDLDALGIRNDRGNIIKMIPQSPHQEFGHDTVSKYVPS